MALNIIIRSIGIFVVATVTFFSIYNGISLFTWHPILMSVGVSIRKPILFVLFIYHFVEKPNFIEHIQKKSCKCYASFNQQFLLIMTEAILAFSSDAFISRGLKYNDRLTLHWILQLSGGILISIAFWSIYTHKTNNNYNHFYSQHASMGLNTCIMVIGTTSGGIAARYNSTFRNIIKPAYLKIIHSTFGVITYSMAIFTVYLGLDSAWFRAQSSTQWVIILTYAVATLAILALSKPIISIANKVRNTLR